MNATGTNAEREAAREAARIGFFPTTVALLERMRRTQELEPSLLALLARAYLETGNRDGALECVEKLTGSTSEDAGSEVQQLLERLREEPDD